MAVKNPGYTAEQAEALDRAMEAQYDADEQREAGGPSEERRDWRRIRDLAAIVAFSPRRRQTK
jgi:hypothetical protein